MGFVFRSSVLVTVFVLFIYAFIAFDRKSYFEYGRPLFYESRRTSESPDDCSSGGVGLESKNPLVHGKSQPNQQSPPTIYIITPTHTRLEQKVDLLRMSYTLRLIPKVHWVVVEDSGSKTDLVVNLLKHSGISFTHLNVSSAKHASRRKSGVLSQRGLLQRNAGLDWLRHDLATRDHPGVVYFGDDDNTYSVQLFSEMRHTKKISVWPVGLLFDRRFETPIVQDGKVVGWFAWAPHRSFAIDMAGFAVSLALIQDNPKAAFAYSKPGQLETNFISSLGVTMDDLEPRANLCTEVLVWHTRTEKTRVQPKNLKKQVFIKQGVKDRDKLIERFTSDSYFEV